MYALVKHFRVHQRGAGLRASLRSLVRREHVEVRAVDGVSFASPPGEVVGFLGPNGAGKTTTLKCLTGLLHPTSGSVRVLGHEPFRAGRRAFLERIALVMGQRNSLFWDLPALDAFAVTQAIYRMPAAQYRETLDELVDLLDLEPLLGKQVRTLSLGERMRCEIAGSLLHRPRGALPRRADARPRRQRPGRDPRVPRGLQRAARGDRAADQPLHGRRHGAGRSGCWSSTPAGCGSTATSRPARAARAVPGAAGHAARAGDPAAARRPTARSTSSTAPTATLRVPRASAPRRWRPACSPTCRSTTSRSRTRRSRTCVRAVFAG